MLFVIGLTLAGALTFSGCDAKPIPAQTKLKRSVLCPSDSIPRTPTRVCNFSLTVVAQLIPLGKPEVYGFWIRAAQNVFSSANRHVFPHGPTKSVVITSKPYVSLLTERRQGSIPFEIFEMNLPTHLSLDQMKMNGFFKFEGFAQFLESHRASNEKQFFLFLDLDILIVDSINSLFLHNWDMAVAVMPMMRADFHLNLGVIGVSHTSVPQAIWLFNQVSSLTSEFALQDPIGVLDQRAFYSLVLQYQCVSGKKFFKPGCISLCTPAGNLSVSLLQNTKWNAVPAAMTSYTSIVHFKGKRKKQMVTFPQSRAAVRNFLRTRCQRHNVSCGEEIPAFNMKHC